MPYAQLDDRFHSHPKIRRVSLAARGLFVTGISFAACFLTDGYLPPEFADDHLRRAGDRRAAAELLNAGLWVREGDGYRIRDYLDHNRSAEQVKADRERARERQARSRDRHRQEVLPWTP